MSPENTKALIARLRTLLATVPTDNWQTYSAEGPWKGTTRQLHSVCVYDPQTFNGPHECITQCVGDDEKKAYQIALLIAETHNALPRLLDELEASLDQTAVEAPVAPETATKVTRKPTSPGWWARRKNGTTEWFAIEPCEEEDKPGIVELVIWLDTIGASTQVEKFCGPLTKWYGPVSLPWKD